MWDTGNIAITLAVDTGNVNCELDILCTKINVLATLTLHHDVFNGVQHQARAFSVCEAVIGSDVDWTIRL